MVFVYLPHGAGVLIVRLDHDLGIGGGSRNGGSLVGVPGGGHDGRLGVVVD